MLILIGNREDTYVNMRMQKESSLIGLDYRFLSKFDLGFFDETCPVENSFLISRCSGFDFDDFDLDFIELALDNRNQSLNGPTLTLKHRDKWQGQKHLRDLGFKTIPSYSHRGLLKRTLFQDLNPEAIERDQFIVKNYRSLGGKGVYLFNSHSSLSNYVESRSDLVDQKYMIQPRLKIKNEYRLFFFKQKLWAIIKRFPQKNEFRSNMNKGGSGVLLTRLPSSLDFVVSLASTIKGLNLFSIEFIEAQDNSLYCLEMNTMPGLKELEMLSNDNKVGEIVNFIKNSICQKK